jgi:DNA-3-methyladenine glycosylase
LAGLIAETEAYLGYEDKAAHSYNWRRTDRTETMFADGGTAYVFLTYGIHHLLNIVVATVDVPQAILIRAVEPTEGLDMMYRYRKKAKRETDLCSGPGKVGEAFAIDRRLDGHDMTTGDELFVERVRSRALPSRSIVVRPRIGVDYAGEWAKAPLRFYIAGNPHVSVK